MSTAAPKPVGPELPDPELLAAASSAETQATPTAVGAALRYHVSMPSEPTLNTAAL
jgi:hypothetical protein